MTDATKAALLLGTLALGLVVAGGVAVHQRNQRNQALHQAAVMEGVAHAAQQAEAQAKADRTAADLREEASQRQVARLEAELARRPVPPPAQPVPVDAPATVVVAGLQGLGLHPHLLGAGPAVIGLELPDGRTTLGWGREALRVPGLTARLATLEELAQAQAQHSDAQAQQLAAADRTITAADARADAQAQRAASLQRAIDLTPRWRPTSAGLVVGVDSAGTRHLGAYLTRSWGPVEVGALYLDRHAALMGGIRF